MTVALFFHTDSLCTDAQVVSCESSADGFAVILNQTLFHPQGGGQLGDTGHIGGNKVTKAVKNGEDIIHYSESAVALGQVDIQVDAERRLLNSRLHSAGHLIGHIGEAYGLQAIKGHHWPSEAKVSFKPLSGSKVINAESIQQEIDKLISADLPRYTRTNEDSMRMVGFGTLEPYACGGTHVAHLGMIGSAVITGVKEKKGIISVSYQVV